ncbi:flavin reductase family protein [Streptomyces sp. NBC_00882]|uniref:flavin reductase family protein n=1 Tax=Streptomyces sp. NBC_00882 TaxID=2975856 RepID=UPI00386BE392
MPLVESEDFRAALSRHPAGVVVVTATIHKRRTAITVTSFTSASMDPPLVSFYVKGESSSFRPLVEAEFFGVNFLESGQRTIAETCSRSEVDRFSPSAAWATGPHRIPLLKGATVHLICSREQVVGLGDHHLVVGAVTETRVMKSGRPLIYCDRSYVDLVDTRIVDHEFHQREEGEGG